MPTYFILYVGLTNGKKHLTLGTELEFLQMFPGAQLSHFVYAVTRAESLVSRN